MAGMNRLKLLMIMLLAANMLLVPAQAKDGDSGSGNSGSGGGSDDSDSDSDSDNSGSGNDDDDKDDDSSGDGESKTEKEQERALKAVENGNAVSLRKLKAHLNVVYPGKLLSVKLKRSSGSYYYQVRILTNGNRIRFITLNAKSLKPRQS